MASYGKTSSRERAEEEAKRRLLSAVAVGLACLSPLISAFPVDSSFACV
jgi:hypothetical protein